MVCLKLIKTETFCSLLHFLSRSHLEDDGSDAPRLYTGGIFGTILGHTNMINLMCNWEINEFA